MKCWVTRLTRPTMLAHRLRPLVQLWPKREIVHMWPIRMHSRRNSVYEFVQQHVSKSMT